MSRKNEYMEGIQNSIMQLEQGRQGDKEADEQRRQPDEQRRQPDEQCRLT